MAYDTLNRLITKTPPSPAPVVSYAYDAEGRRKRKTVNGMTTLFVTDADNREVLEYDGARGQVLRWYASHVQGVRLNPAVFAWEESPPIVGDCIPL